MISARDHYSASQAEVDQFWILLLVGGVYYIFAI